MTQSLQAEAEAKIASVFFNARLIEDAEVQTETPLYETAAKVALKCALEILSGDRDSVLWIIKAPPGVSSSGPSVAYDEATVEYYRRELPDWRIEGPFIRAEFLDPA